jgi:coiled-coil domain-containing protein 130
MGGISKFQGSTGANQYQKYGIIRYELPFDAWCLKCNTHMCKGLRFNAKKDKIGKYFSTPIYSFTMKCYSCSQQFVIKTDPEHRTYDFAEGLRKMEQDFEPGAEDSILQPLSDEAKAQLEKDPMFKLQHDKEDKLRASSANAVIESLIDLRDAESKNDYDMNSLLRKKNRAYRARQVELKNEGASRGLGIALSEPSVADADAARAAFLGKGSKGFRTSEKVRMVKILNQPIFASTSLNTKTPSSALVPVRTEGDREPVQLGKEARKRLREGESLEKKAARDISAAGMIIRRRDEGKESKSHPVVIPVSISSKRRCLEDGIPANIEPVAASCVKAIQSDVRTMLCGYGSDSDSF